ncbi:hypothetical protein AJ79_08842 [Helicocarpus griseus UAMH5409]|uniref:DNA endonuclease activator Ctp1 C-terminal domain-containing protein n=1 Tax=Helicocarpus griseus UAMH5409 TaxID=1447875 RepID=A0A2B7WPM6_9EURO|nr:hypothetical protein AJ79_08842 [Helicocarpus griseus UAMH5409]
MEETEFGNLAEQVGGLISQCRQWKQQNRELETKLKEQALKIAALEMENSDLKRHSENIEPSDRADDVAKSLLESRRKYAPNLIVRGFEGKPERPDTISYQQYALLARRYEQLFQENASLLESFFTVKKKLKNCKDKITTWNNCFEHDMFDIYVHGKKVVFQKIDTRGSHGPQNQLQLGLIEAASTPDLVKSKSSYQMRKAESRESNSSKESSSNIVPSEGVSEELESPHLPSANAHARRILEKSSKDYAAEPTSSNITPTQTQDPRYTAEPRIFPSSPPSENPVVVSERPVKGKCGRDDDAQPTSVTAKYHLETGSIAQPVTVESEPTSSSPLGSIHRQDDDECHDDCLDPSTSENDDQDVSPREHTGHKPSKSRGSRFDVFDESEEVKTEPFSDPREQQIIGTKRRLALQPVNRDVSSARNSDQYTPDQTAKRRRYDPRGAEAVPLIAEDGEEVSHSRSKDGFSIEKFQSNTRPEKAESPAANRLEDLLVGAPRPRPVLNSPLPNSGTPRQSPCGTPSKMPPRSTTPKSARPRSVDKKDISARQPQPPASQSLSTSVAPSRPRDDHDISPDDEPFRARPLHRLDFEHFKLNPERNQGLDYAFDEVVRRKDLRKCLPGCVRPGCCGEGFRAMAKLKGFGTGAVGAREDLSLEFLDQEDRQVLNEYLGENKVVLETMTDRELRETLLDARTRNLANQFGKHRHVHERARSPPGFWRTDMPSTQELERDREEAKKVAQEKLAERYREAMRPGGLWKFADE